MAALLGSVVLSGAVLDQGKGIRMQCTKGLASSVAVCLTDQFKATQPGLTMILREACANGWCAVARAGLKARGREAALLLCGDREVESISAPRGVQCLTADAFVDWVTAKFLERGSSALVAAQK